MNKENNNIIKIVAFIIVVVAVIIIGVGVFFLPKGNKTNKVEDNSSEKNAEKTSENDTEKSDVVMYINDYKVIMGKTKISDLISNTKLSVVCNEEHNLRDYKTNKPSGRFNFYKLTDGVNIINVLSKDGDIDVVNSISTLKDNQIDDPAFDTSKGTKIEVEDMNFKNSIKIGDTLIGSEALNSSNILNASGQIYSTQSKGKINYYKDENDVVGNVFVYGEGEISSVSCSAE